MRRLLAALIALPLAGCGSTEQAAQSMRTGWIGKRSDEFFARHGAAQREQRLNDGRRVYIWQTVANAPGGGPQVWCSADIVTSPAGVIVEIRPRTDSLGLWNASRCTEIFS